MVYLIDIIGIFLVLGVFLWRFNIIPTAPAQSVEGVGLGGKVLKLFWPDQRATSELFFPPRANTTLFKYRLYQFTYALLGLLTYLAIWKLPALGNEFQAIIQLVDPSEQFTIPKNVGPVVMAFVIAVLLPMVPPFSAWDAAIRWYLYERAAIPAQQLRERNRLKKSPYLVEAEDLVTVRNRLCAEGFTLEDIQYDELQPTICSLWTKASLLMEGISHWQAKDKYKTAFAILKERDGAKSSVKVLQEQYEALIGDAKVCLSLRRDASNEPETAAREAAFRQNCKALLEQIYDLLSRVSLHAHFSDRERVREMNQLGFGIKLDWGGPTPGANDLLWLGVILGLIFVLPLSNYTGLAKAITIGTIMFTTVLTPLLLMSQFPHLAMKAQNGIPTITFPVLSMVIAVLVGMLISIAYHAIIDFDVQASWDRYTEGGYPWSYLYGLIALLVAWRMQVGTYPEQTELMGIARYRLWGSLRDAGIFGVAVAALMLLLVLPALKVPAGIENYLPQLVFPVSVAMGMGLIVPTWYRAQTRRKKRDRRQSGAAARAKFQDKMNTNYGFNRRQSSAG